MAANAHINARLDEGVEAEKMVGTVVQKVIDLRGYRLLDDLLKEKPT